MTLQGRFEGYFEEGKLREGKAGEVYDEPIGKVHRGHNPDPEVPLLGIAIALPPWRGLHHQRRGAALGALSCATAAPPESRRNAPASAIGRVRLLIPGV